ncbi:peptidase dimerization domain-containing protein [Bradyrhizobium liaoningense]
MMAAFDSFAIEIKGKGGHAATPNLAVDSVLTLSSLVVALQSIVAVNVDPKDPVVLSTCQIHAGDVDNVIPHSGRLSGSIRTLDSKAGRLCEERGRAIAESTARAYRAIANVDYRTTIPAVVNEETGTARFIRAALRVVRADRVNTSILPEMGSEDFASSQQKCPGSFMLSVTGNSNTFIIPHTISTTPPCPLALAFLFGPAWSRSYNDVG